MDKLKEERRIRRLRRKQGLCLRCDQPSVEGKTHCQAHRMYMNAASHRSYTKKIRSRLAVKLAVKLAARLALLLFSVFVWAQQPQQPSPPVSLTAHVEGTCYDDPCLKVPCYTLPENVKKDLTWTNPADIMYWSNEWNQLFSLQGPAPGQEWLPQAYVGMLYCTYLRAGGGRRPYAFSADVLPPGFTLDSQTGLLSGRATSSSISFITFTVRDMLGVTAQIRRNLETCYPEGPCGFFGSHLSQLAKPMGRKQ